MKKRYEVLENGILYPHNSFEKNREGLAQAYEQAEEIMLDRGDDLDILEIQSTSYDSTGKIVNCELVEDFTLTLYI